MSDNFELPNVFSDYFTGPAICEMFLEQSSLYRKMTEYEQAEQMELFTSPEYEEIVANVREIEFYLQKSQERI